MGRRRRSSPLEDLLELISLMPWWAGIAIAFIGYFALHSIAVGKPAPGDVTGALIRGLASAGQYIVPLIGLIGAVVSAMRRKQAKKLVDTVTQSASHDALSGMSWREFEVLVAEGFRLQGFQVLENGGGGPDGGIDMVLSRPGSNGSEKYLVQCKQWRAFKVGVDVVRELYGVMAARGAAGGFVVTSGRFTEEAMNFAQGRNVRLVDGPKLHELIRQAKGRRDEGNFHASSRREAPAAAPETAPSCPACSAKMVLRTSKRGASAGDSFWGCTRFPTCRGTRPTA